MRVKGFIIFIIIFTIIYILFFILFDKYMNKANDTSKLLKKELDMSKYYNFSKFYGINSSIDKNIIIETYNLIKDTSNIKISYIANELQIKREDVGIIVLYLEYMNYIREKSINYETDMITNFNQNDKALFDKYINYFRNKSDLKTIQSNCGNETVSELIYLTRYFLVEGVRFDGNKIYYAGDYNV